MTPAIVSPLIPDRALEYLLENIATSFSYILLFAGMLTLVQDWRPGRRRMWYLLVPAILVLQPVLYYSNYLTIGKLLYAISSVAALVVCCRRRTPAFWLSLSTMCMVVCFCGGLSSLFLLLFPVFPRLLFKVPLTVLSYVLVRRFLRPLIRQLEQTAYADWGHLCAVPLGLLTFIIFSTLALDDYARGGGHVPILLAVSLLALLSMVYGVLVYFFRSAFLRQQQTHDNDVLRTQMISVARRAEEINRQDEAERVFRHDLRHYINALITCIDAGAYDEARVLIGRAQQSVAGLESARQAITRYTGQPVLDAVLSSYGSAFSQCGVQYEVALCPPDSLRVDLVELSAVLSNALENALHACSALPKGRARSVRVLGEPHGAQFLLTISNTCPPDTALDPATGLPHTSRPGHGYGTRSIAAFALRSNGVLDYQITGGWFSMNLLL